MKIVTGAAGEARRDRNIHRQKRLISGPERTILVPCCRPAELFVPCTGKDDMKRIPAVLALLILIPFQPLHAGGKKEITGYGPFNFNETVTPGEVERAGGVRLSELSKGKIYAFEPYERFEGLVDFYEYHKLGKISPARESGSVPKITSTEVRLEDGKLWLIILYFNPKDYDDYLRVIKLEYGEPSRKTKGTPRKDFWLRGGNCITLEQVSMQNISTGGHLEIQKGRCEGLARR